MELYELEIRPRSESIIILGAAGQPTNTLTSGFTQKGGRATSPLLRFWATEAYLT